MSHNILLAIAISSPIYIPFMFRYKFRYTIVLLAFFDSFSRLPTHSPVLVRAARQIHHLIEHLLLLI